MAKTAAITNQEVADNQTPIVLVESMMAMMTAATDKPKATFDSISFFIVFALFNKIKHYCQNNGQ